MEAASALLARAFDPEVETPQDATSERILDAALALCAASGIRNLTMDDVASRAGVGRMTVYRRFGDRRRLVEALAVRESRRCLAQLDAEMDPSRTAREQVADGFWASLRLMREHPLLNRLARSEPDAVLDALTVEDGALLVLMRAFVATRLRDALAAEGRPTADAERSAELLVRLCVSFVVLQDSVLPLDDERAARDVARRLIAPIVFGD